MIPILFDFPMPITSKRLLIRPPIPGEASIVNDAIQESFKEIHATIPWAQEIPTVEQTEEFIRRAAANWILKKNEEPYLPLFIFDRNQTEFLGCTGYHHYEWEIPNLQIGYWLRTSRVGQGIMTEAVNAILQYAFNELKIKRAAITCGANNIRSKNVCERLGFSLEGILKADRIDPITGEISDTLLYAKYDLLGMPSLQVEW